MKTFSRIEAFTDRVKCHYQGCFNPAEYILDNDMYTIFLCSEHNATEKYIAASENLPNKDGLPVYLVITIDNPNEEKE